ncbi:AAA domain-containing protein [Amycolatopsis sulphurea]|uniref:AAA domain-containing protein n=1 Tax=Amycolatopsis sulphurea TaxID=76022 RepID=A0A2A9FCZ9_9PSEU|nr:AAA family ATPase [Amycolatopsis sulphurea]PFG48666.1 AAA domain-containing protein [Amycolatopsis sulphurea]
MTYPETNGRHLRPVTGSGAGAHELDPGPFPEPPADPYDTAPAALRQVRLTRVSTIPLRPTHWLWDARIPHGALTVGPGREGIGKSLFCAWLAARITLGELPGKHYGQPRSVIYAATEDSWERTLAGRLHVAGADLDRVYRVEVDQLGGTAVPLSLPRDVDGMASVITTHDVALLIVDPLISVLDGSINPHQDRDLRTGLEPLVQLADDTGCAIFGLAHFNKASGTDVLSRIMGGRAFSAVARAVIAFARDTTADDGSCVISQVKNNLGALDLPSLRYIVDSVGLDTPEGPAQWGRMQITGETDTHVNDLLDDAPPTREERTDAEAVADWLREYLTSQGGQAPSGEVKKAAKAAGFTERTAQRARAKLQLTTRTEGRNTVWGLP